MELQEHTGEGLELADTGAAAMWPDVKAFVMPNLGATERWVPYHTVLGVHELFLVQNVHTRSSWTKLQRFQAMVIFRAHCKGDLFGKVQLPLMLTKGFWKDPRRAFMPGGAMEKAMLKYRRTTKSPLITSCFRIIPERILKDDDENLVRSITIRTLRLLDIAEGAFRTMQDKRLSAAEKLTAISCEIRKARGLGDTWAKMLLVCIDLAHPQEQLLESQCEVGSGAAPPLRCLLKGKAMGNDKKAALKELQKDVNCSKSAHANRFWNLLKKQEKIIRRHFKDFPLVCAQASTKERGMSASTLQVQLCEYRQFRNSVARLKHGLPEDESMRAEPEASGRVTANVQLEKHRATVAVQEAASSHGAAPDAAGLVIEVPFKAVGNEPMVARRVASLVFERFRGGASKEEAESFKAELISGYRSGQEDVDPESEAWNICRTNQFHVSPVVGFNVAMKDGSKVHFQTTQGAAGGSVLEAERIARLCWKKFQAGAKKEAVLKYRTELYAQIATSAQGGRKRSLSTATKVAGSSSSSSGAKKLRRK